MGQSRPISVKSDPQVILMSEQVWETLCCVIRLRTQWKLMGPVLNLCLSETKFYILIIFVGDL